MKATVEKIKVTEGWVFTPEKMLPEFIFDIHDNRISVYQRMISRTTIFPKAGMSKKSEQQKT
jgi:hypothetical protein